MYLVLFTLVVLFTMNHVVNFAKKDLMKNEIHLSLSNM